MKYEAYVICTSPRSGSTLLCQLLTQTGKAGVPNSHFHTPRLASWRAALALDKINFPSRRAALCTTLKAVKIKGMSDTGIFGLRIQQGSFEYLISQLALAHPDKSTHRKLFEAAFGKTLFIYLRRENTLEQAISCVKAMQTGLWHQSADGSEFERLSPPKELFFDPDAISAHIDEFSQANATWQDWFATQAISPLEITYEQLALNPEQLLQTVMDELGVVYTPPPDFSPPLAKLANQINAQWAEQYQQVLAAPDKDHT